MRSRLSPGVDTRDEMKWRACTLGLGMLLLAATAVAALRITGRLAPINWIHLMASLATGRTCRQVW